MAIRFSILFLLLCSAAFAANLPPEQATSSPGSAYVGRALSRRRRQIPLSAIGVLARFIFLDCVREYCHKRRCPALQAKRHALSGPAENAHSSQRMRYRVDGKSRLAMAYCYGDVRKRHRTGKPHRPRLSNWLSSGAANISFTSAHVPDATHTSLSVFTAA